MTETKSEYKIEGRPSTIFRVAKNKDNPYVMIDKRIIDNDNLSFKAKGILVYLLSRPDGWEVNQADISSRSIDGLGAVKSGIKELKEAGYLRHAGTRTAKGQFATVIWEVYEVPQVDNRPTDSPYMGVSSPQVEKPQVDNPQADNCIQVLKELSNKGLSNNTTTTADVDISREVFRIYSNEIGVITPGIRDSIGMWLDDPKIPWEWITDAMTIAANHNKRNWAYCEAILRRWAVEGKVPMKKEPSGPKYSNKLKGDNAAFLAALERA